MNYLKSIFLFIILFNSNGSFAQDTTKVLFIGNSFTSANNLPSLFSQLAENAGHHVVVASHMPGGISVGDIRQGAQAHMNNPYVYNLIKGNDWDYMVLQDNQGRFSHPYGQFADPVTQSSVIKGHLMLRDSLLHYNPCAHMLWFGGFGTKTGVALGYPTGVALIDAIYANYNFLNDTAQQVIVPIGPAFKRIILGHPSINLWGADDTHPSLHGSFLSSCVIFSTVFKESPILSTYNPGITAADDILLKTVAYQTATDSLNATGLNSITPLINQSANTLSVSNQQQCRWFYNNAPYTSTNCVATINQSGNYYAIVTDSNGCNFKTMAYTHTSTPVGLEEYIAEHVSIYPNPTNSNLKMSVEGLSGFFEYTLSTTSGEMITHQNVNTNTATIDVTNQPLGVYILQMKIGDMIITKKIMKL